MITLDRTPHVIGDCGLHLGLEVLPHPPYSPDLGASDYHHFGPMEKMLGGRAEIRIRYRGAISRFAVA